MPPIVPPSRPQQDRDNTDRILREHGITDGFGLLGVRGYYLRSMGAVDRNDRGIYDDAIMLLSPEAYVTFNANCDPSIHRKHIATLEPGVYQYKLGIHGVNKPKPRQYQALVQAGPVTVARDEEGAQTGYFGINIHRGSYNSTSSEGCQTVHPSQWEAFIALVRQELKRMDSIRIPYALIENQ